MNTETALDLLVIDPLLSTSNFNLAQSYEDEGQTAAAISFYLRCAEFSTDILESYESMLRVYLCFDRQADRKWMAENVLLRAVSLMPDRPEGYYLASKFYEVQRYWVKSYAFARIGETLTFKDERRLKTDVGYPGRFVFKFQRSVSAWWIGLYNEAIQLSNELSTEKMPESFAIPVRNNIRNLTNLMLSVSKYGPNLDYPYYLQKENMKYNISMHHRLKLKFPGSSKIIENYSQCYQDLFVLGVHRGKQHGRFLEIGCGVPIFNNNTYLLEKEYQWDGISIDLNKNVTDLFSKYRKSTVINGDATKIDYEEILVVDGDYDYLQIDCDPALISYKVLLKIPFERHRFAVIHFEHDHHIDENKEVRELSRQYLSSLGYLMIVNDISFNDYTAFEDWWVHPAMIDAGIVGKMYSVKDGPNRADEYMFNQKPGF